MEINGKTAIVTGGTNGIGRTIAEYLHNEGVYVCIFDKKIEGIKEFDEFGLCLYQCDVTSDRSRKLSFNSVMSSRGSLDILVNCAGGNLPERDYRTQFRSDFAKYGMEIYQPILDLNLLAPIGMMNEVIPHMRENHSGVIINISSVNAAAPLESPAYSIAKAGLEHATRLYARAYARHGIRVNAVRSGPVATEDTLALYEKDPEQKRIVLDSTLSKRIGETDDVARVVLNLIENDAFIGSIVTVDGGFLLDTPFFRNTEK